MKTKDFIFRSPGGAHDTLCRVRMFQPRDNEIVVLLTDVGRKNPGPSVTNSVEKIRRRLILEGHIDHSSLVIEHYDEHAGRRPTFDVVTFDNEDSPRWHSIELRDVVEMCGTTQQEIQADLSDSELLRRELDIKRFEIWPEMDSPPKESEIILKRRQEIMRSMIPKTAISSLVQAGAAENDFQKLLKSDLSVLGEMYGMPDEEYIAFSEFPIGAGRADFVVFTSRSRMEVVIIEVKGADFAFLNADSYGNLSSKINEAAQQVRERIGNINRDYEKFRLFVHDVRQKVEKGKRLYNSLLCPDGGLQVDPNKDIAISGIVIGGRCRDDLRESRIRHQFQMTTHPNIRLESWDSWVKKLKKNRRTLNPFL